MYICKLTSGSNQPPIPNTAYGTTKAVVNWFIVRINSEDAWLNAFVMDPGWVQTDLGNAGAHNFGAPHAELTIEESCNGMIKVFGETSKAKHGRKMIGWEGDVKPL